MERRQDTDRSARSDPLPRSQRQLAAEDCRRKANICECGRFIVSTGKNDEKKTTTKPSVFDRLYEGRVTKELNHRKLASKLIEEEARECTYIPRTNSLLRQAQAEFPLCKTASLSSMSNRERRVEVARRNFQQGRICVDCLKKIEIGTGTFLVENMIRSSDDKDTVQPMNAFGRSSLAPPREIMVMDKKSQKQKKQKMRVPVDSIASKDSGDDIVKESLAVPPHPALHGSILKKDKIFSFYRPSSDVMAVLHHEDSLAGVSVDTAHIRNGPEPISAQQQKQDHQNVRVCPNNSSDSSDGSEIGGLRLVSYMNVLSDDSLERRGTAKAAMAEPNTIANNETGPKVDSADSSEEKQETRSLPELNVGAPAAGEYENPITPRSLLRQSGFNMEEISLTGIIDSYVEPQNQERESKVKETDANTETTSLDETTEEPRLRVERMPSVSSTESRPQDHVSLFDQATEGSSLEHVRSTSILDSMDNDETSWMECRDEVEEMAAKQAYVGCKCEDDNVEFTQQPPEMREEPSCNEENSMTDLIRANSSRSHASPKNEARSVSILDLEEDDNNDDIAVQPPRGLDDDKVEEAAAKKAYAGCELNCANLPPDNKTSGSKLNGEDVSKLQSILEAQLPSAESTFPEPTKPSRENPPPAQTQIVGVKNWTTPSFSPNDRTPERKLVARQENSCFEEYFMLGWSDCDCLCGSPTGRK